MREKMSADTDFVFKIEKACLQFKQRYDCIPEKIGVLYTRHLDRLGITLNLLDAPTPVNSPLSESITIRREYVPFEPFIGIGYTDFRLYSEKTGIIDPSILL
jgi:hypothetical protein